MTEPWSNRIVGEGELSAEDIIAHPMNNKIHIPYQRRMTDKLIGEVGFIEPIVINRRTGYLVNGHLRVEIAMAKGDLTPLPVTYIDCDEADEAFVIATLDPVSRMATYDAGRYEDLVAQVAERDLETMNFLQRSGADAGVTTGTIVGDEGFETVGRTGVPVLSVLSFGRFAVPVAQHEQDALYGMIEEWQAEHETLVGFAGWLVAPSIADLPAEYFDADEEEDDDGSDDE